MDDTERSEFATEQLQCLQEMVRSSAWREVAMLRLHQKVLRLQERLAGGHRMPLEEIRELQAEHRVLSLILRDAYQFFKPEE